MTLLSALPPVLVRAVSIVVAVILSPFRVRSPVAAALPLLVESAGRASPLAFALVILAVSAVRGLEPLASRSLVVRVREVSRVRRVSAAGLEAVSAVLEILFVLVLGEVVIVEVLEVGLFAAASTALRVVMGLLRMGETPVFVVVLLVVLSFAG